MARRTVTFEGILPAMVTPMDSTGALDEAALTKLTDRLIRAGSGGLIPCGSTGEFTSLSLAERRRVTEVVVKAAAGRVPVAPHTGALTAREAIELSTHAQEAGASAVMLIAPFYEPLQFADIKEYYRAVAAAIDIPIIIYNLPGATNVCLDGEQLKELATIDGVDSVKDSSANAVLLTELLQRYSKYINVMNGWDSLTFYGLVAGARASVWGAANFIPGLAVELFESIYRRQNLDEARDVWSRIWPICKFLETAGSYVAAVKAGCELIGEPAGDPRDPILPLEATKKAELAGLLRAATGTLANT
jgi:dihydrodipicolinate synthase/N-acetylneuraminate lyase